MSVQVSVVVPTYNRPELLHNCLAALLQQDFSPDEYEIIVVDNAGSEGTRRLVETITSEGSRTDAAPVSDKEAAVRPSVHHIVENEKPGPAAARNAGWRYAHGDIIAFTDDDCLPQRDWLKEGVRVLRDGFDAVSGRVIVPVEGVPSDYERNIGRLETAEFVTANCFLRCSTLLRTGGFNEEFTTAWREDSELHFHLLQLSLKLGRASQAVVVHPVRAAPWGISLREQRKSMFNALLYKKHPRLYRERIQSQPPWKYYAIVALGLLWLVTLLTNAGPLWRVFGLLWGGLTGAFAVERLEHTRHTAGHVAEMVVTSILIPPLSVFWRVYGALKYRVWFL